MLNESIRITIIGGEGLFQDALAESLAGQTDFRVTGVFPSVEKALPLFQATQANVLLLAMDFDERTGSAAAARARDAGFGGGVLIVISGICNSQQAQPWRDRAGVFPLSQPATMLHQRIRQIADSRNACSAPHTASISDGKELPKLTLREADVLLGVYRCCSNKEIGAELGISENTVKTYIQQLFRKSGAHTRSQLVRMVVERDWGQQMTGEPEEPAPSPVPAAGEPAYLSVSAIGSSSLAA